MNNQELAKIFESHNGGTPFSEILTVATMVHGDIDLDVLRRVDDYITSIFSGKHPEFQRSNTKYHNLRHTRNVVLATVRLLHGYGCRKPAFLSAETVLQGIISAYFHDSGLLLTTAETADSGACYIKNHEERSVHYMCTYGSQHKLSHQFLEGCKTIIDCTNLHLDPTQITFASDEHRIAGHIVGTADILSQMADRFYLERLPQLFLEQEDGGVNVYDSAIELMEQTASFYHDVIVDRLENSFHDIGAVMKSHFQARWQLDLDLYSYYIKQNIRYLKKITADYNAELDSIEHYLRRTPPNDPY